ncbi:hypothetical protein BC827DRAFT_1200393 [Russula dissimulans]|nr:hypothetical protein BC827DRAFT_1200393 [Russula dissimulans]
MLVAADWQMRNKIKNCGMLTPKFIWRLIKIGWLTVEDVKFHFHLNDYIELVRYNNRPDEQRYPFVLPRNVRMPTAARRVRMRRTAGLDTHDDDLPDSIFFKCEHENGNDIYISDYHHHHHHDYRDRPSTPRDPVVAALETGSGSGLGSGTARRETEAKGKKGKGAAKSRSRAKKPLRRECSRPEV